MPHAKVTDPDTSHEAAKSVRNITETQKTILWIYNRHGAMVDDELVRYYNSLVRYGEAPRASLSGIKTRRKELVVRGLVIDTGQRQKLASGRNAIVWRVA